SSLGELEGSTGSRSCQSTEGSEDSSGSISSHATGISSGRNVVVFAAVIETSCAGQSSIRVRILFGNRSFRLGLRIPHWNSIHNSSSPAGRFANDLLPFFDSFGQRIGRLGRGILRRGRRFAVAFELVHALFHHLSGLRFHRIHFTEMLGHAVAVLIDCPVHPRNRFACCVAEHWIQSHAFGHLGLFAKQMVPHRKPPGSAGYFLSRTHRESLTHNGTQPSSGESGLWPDLRPYLVGIFSRTNACGSSLHRL